MRTPTELQQLMGEAVQAMKTKDCAIEMHHSVFGDKQILKIVQLRYNDLGRQLKSTTLLDGVFIVGPFSETLRQIADLIDGTVTLETPE